VNADRKDFLSVTGVIPARLDSQETAWFLGFAAHDIPILVKAGLLKPLGHPPPNAVKYFSSEVLMKLCPNLKWMSRATDAIIKHWQNKNATKDQLHENETV
jgi:hypothetical protein